MTMKSKIFQLLTDWAHRVVSKRSADEVIAVNGDTYLMRWYLIPHNRLFNVYLHWFLHSDDDRALHDHPWVNFSLLIQGSYIEHGQTISGIPTWDYRRAGDWHFRRSGRYAHRIELIDNEPCWTIFITGPKYREWGFHCPKGWVHNRDFNKRYGDGSSAGCD